MPQHFLLSAEARNLSPIAIARMSEHEAVMTMKKLRWGEASYRFLMPIDKQMTRLALLPDLAASDHSQSDTF